MENLEQNTENKLKPEEQKPKPPKPIPNQETNPPEQKDYPEDSPLKPPKLFRQNGFYNERFYNGG